MTKNLLSRASHPPSSLPLASSLSLNICVFVPSYLSPFPISSSKNPKSSLQLRELLLICFTIISFPFNTSRSLYWTKLIGCSQWDSSNQWRRCISSSFILHPFLLALLSFSLLTRKILSKTKRNRQTLMTSATWPDEINEIASKHLFGPVKLTVGGDVW